MAPSPILIEFNPEIESILIKFKEAPHSLHDMRTPTGDTSEVSAG